VTDAEFGLRGLGRSTINSLCPATRVARPSSRRPVIQPTPSTLLPPLPGPEHGLGPAGRTSHSRSRPPRRAWREKGRTAAMEAGDVASVHGGQPDALEPIDRWPEGLRTVERPGEHGFRRLTPGTPAVDGCDWHGACGRARSRTRRARGLTAMSGQELKACGTNRSSSDSDSTTESGPVSVSSSVRSAPAPPASRSQTDRPTLRRACPRQGREASPAVRGRAHCPPAARAEADHREAARGRVASETPLRRRCRSATGNVKAGSDPGRGSLLRSTGFTSPPPVPESGRRQGPLARRPTALRVTSEPGPDTPRLPRARVRGLRRGTVQCRARSSPGSPRKTL